MDDPIRVSAWCFFCQRKVQGLRKNFFYSLYKIKIKLKGFILVSNEFD